MFCENCGNKINDGAMFCGKCGIPQNASEQDLSSSTNPTIGASYMQQAIHSKAVAIQAGKKNKKLLFIIIGVVAVIILLIVILVNAFGNSISIEDVKTGYLPYYSESKTIGNAFDNYSYFDDISWEEFDGETDDGKVVSVVEFNATIMMDNIDSYDDLYASDYVYETLTVQFYTDNDMDSDEFEIYGIWFSDVDGDGTDINLDDYDFEDILNCIYSDEMFLLIPSDYGLYYS